MSIVGDVKLLIYINLHVASILKLLRIHTGFFLALYHI